MHSWEVVCVVKKEDSEHKDCRSIEGIGFRVANKIQKRNIDQVYSMMESGLASYYIMVDGEKLAFKSVSVDGIKYVRTLDTDDENDDLMKLKNCE